MKETELFQGVIDEIKKKRIERKNLIDKMPKNESKDTVKTIEHVMSIDEDRALEAMEQGIKLFSGKE